MQRKLKLFAVAGAVLSASAAFAGPAFAAGTLNGAGSTLVAPIMAYWASGYQNKYGNTVNYSSVGSGTGIKDISQRQVDFGASDAPLTPAQASACNGCYQVPWALTGVGITYNLNGIGRLRMSGPVLAQIYLGQITNWNDGRILALNPTAKLPNEKITPVFRSDGSGDTYAYTDYLSRVSGTWAAQVGHGTSVSFPTGVGGKGNSGVVQTVQGTPGSIAYVGVAYLIANRMPAAAVKNAAGRYEYPNLANIENAAQSLHRVPASNEMHIVNPSKRSKIAYPISTFTYVIAPGNAPQGYLLRQFIRYVLTTGQRFGPSLDFAPIPKVVLNAANRTLSAIQ